MAFLRGKPLAKLGLITLVFSLVFLAGCLGEGQPTPSPTVNASGMAPTLVPAITPNPSNLPPLPPNLDEQLNALQEAGRALNEAVQGYPTTLSLPGLDIDVRPFALTLSDVVSAGIPATKQAPFQVADGAGEIVGAGHQADAWYEGLGYFYEISASQYVGTEADLWDMMKRGMTPESTSNKQIQIVPVAMGDRSYMVTSYEQDNGWTAQLMVEKGKIWFRIAAMGLEGVPQPSIAQSLAAKVLEKLPQ